VGSHDVISIAEIQIAYQACSEWSGAAVPCVSFIPSGAFRVEINDVPALCRLHHPEWRCEYSAS
jgi:hypothetical protein